MEESRTEKNMFSGCMTTCASVIVCIGLAFVNINVAMIFALIMVLIVMMIMQ